jgi:hypothetical protein
MAERREAKNAERSFASKILFRNILPLSLTTIGHFTHHYLQNLISLKMAERSEASRQNISNFVF